MVKAGFWQGEGRWGARREPGLHTARRGLAGVGEHQEMEGVAAGVPPIEFCLLKYTSTSRQPAAYPDLLPDMNFLQKKGTLQGFLPLS